MSECACAIHLIGVCGTAMATLAALLKHRGHDVQRLRRARLSADERLPRGRGHHACSRAIAPSTSTATVDLVVVGNAISRGNAELEAVLDRGIRYCSLPEAIRDHFLWDAHSIVIAGTHGKTTTTSLAGWLLTHGGADPTVLVGGIARNFGDDGASYRIGKGKAFVIEGDEYDSAFFDKTAKFLKYLPDIAVINNIEFDHADIYADLDEVRLAFRRLVNLVPRNGLTLLGADSPDAAALAAHARSRVQTFGLSTRRRLARRRHRASTQRHRVPACSARRRGSRRVHDAAARRAQRAQRAGGDRRRRRPRPATSSGCARAWRRSRASSGGSRWSARRAASRSTTTSRTIRPRSTRRCKAVRRCGAGQAHLGHLRAALRLVVPARVSGRLCPRVRRRR